MRTQAQWGLEASAYVDPTVFEAEQDAIFARTWHLVGHGSQVGEHGKVLTATIGRDPILIVNDRGTIRGLFNVCQHRGHELVPPGETERHSLTCPYHAWTYDLDGRLLTARGERVGELCLPLVRVETAGGFLFATVDDELPSLADTIGPVGDEILALAPDAPERVLTSRRTHEFRANWKIAVENYNECYHCPNVHKAFTRGVIDPTTFRITPSGATIRHAARGVAAERSGYDRAPDQDGYGAWYTWPLSSIQCYPGRVLNTFRWVPLAVDRTLLIREWWLDRAEPTPEQQTIIDLDWDTTVAEDFGIMESVQRGVASRGFTPGPLIVDASGTADVHAENAVAHLRDLFRSAVGST